MRINVYINLWISDMKIWAIGVHSLTLSGLFVSSVFAQPAPKATPPLERPSQLGEPLPRDFDPKSIAEKVRKKFRSANFLRMKGTVTQGKEHISFQSWMGKDRVRLEIHDPAGRISYAMSSVGGRVQECSPKWRVSTRTTTPQTNVYLEYDATPGRVTTCLLLPSGCIFGTHTVSWMLPEDCPPADGMLNTLENGEFVGTEVRNGLDCLHFRQAAKLASSKPTDLTEVSHDVYVETSSLRLAAWLTTQTRANGTATLRVREFDTVELLVEDPDWTWAIDPKSLFVALPAERSKQDSPESAPSTVNVPAKP